MSASKAKTIDAIVLADTAYVIEMKAPPRGAGAGAAAPVEAWLREAVNLLNRAVTPSKRLAVETDASTGALKVVGVKAATNGVHLHHLTVTADDARTVSSKKLVVFIQYLLVTLGPLGLGRAQRGAGNLQSAWDATVGNDDGEDSMMLHVPTVASIDKEHPPIISPTISGINASRLKEMSSPSPARRLLRMAPSSPATPTRSSPPPQWPSLDPYLKQAQT